MTHSVSGTDDLNHKHDIPCDLCGGTDTTPFWFRGRNDEPVTTVFCNYCGLAFISPRPPPGEVRDLYTTGDFSEHARGSAAPDRRKFVLSEKAGLTRFRNLINHAPQVVKTPGRALEIGCGIGSFLRLIKGLGWEVHGLEPDPVYARTGNEAYSLQIEPKLYEDFQADEGSYQLVALFHVLEHVNSPSQTLQQIYRHLTPEGLLYIEVPTLDHPLGGNLNFFFWSAHLFSYSTATLQEFLHKAGFQILHSGFASGNLEIIAKRPATPKAYAGVPQADVGAIRNRLSSANRRYQLLHSNKLLGTLPKIERNLQRLLTTLRSDPAEVPAVARRKLRGARLNVETKSAISRIRRSVTGKYAAHYGMHVVNNAGDVLLFEAVRQTFKKELNINKWGLFHLWKEITDKDVERLNRDCSMLIIGGGGLLLPDTNANSNSGWQWNCPTELVEKIEIPLIVYAVGYNLFRGHSGFSPEFAKNISSVVRKSTFFGLRNRGSIEALPRYLDTGLAEKLTFQPCPTTVSRHLYPKYASTMTNTPTRNLAFNIAFDRPQMRYEGREDEVFRFIAKALKELAETGWILHLAAHQSDDSLILPWLIRDQVPFKYVHLEGRSPSTILAFYREMAITVGMRGHAQMIPFGVGNAIISLISHDKLGFFLSDIGHSEWGIDIHDADLTQKLVGAVNAIAGNWESTKQKLDAAQDILWQYTQENMAAIGKGL